MLKRTLLAAAVLSALAAPAAQAQSASAPHAPSRHAPSSAPPKRLWYRILATADLTKTGDVPVLGGGYSEHRFSHVKFRLYSRAAVVLYRQCNATNVDGFDPELVAEMIDAARSAVTCGQLRAKMRELGFSRAWIRRAHLVEDVRFVANADGFADQLERKVDVDAHVTTTPTLSGEPIDCPAQTVAIFRTSAPEGIVGSVQTNSAARDGVSVGFRAPLPLDADGFTGSEGGPCHVRSTGAEILVPHLVGGFRGEAFGDMSGYGGRPPTPAPLRFEIGHRFGRSFSIDASESVHEQVDNVDWLLTGSARVAFQLCPRGGRDVSGC
jgi:hypothetical protein